jgi:hypothetical protein
VQRIDTHARQALVIHGVDRDDRTRRDAAGPTLGREVLTRSQERDQRGKHSTQWGGADVIPQLVLDHLRRITGTVNDPDPANPLVEHGRRTDQERGLTQPTPGGSRDAPAGR